MSIVIEINGVQEAHLRIARLPRWKPALKRQIGEMLKRQHEERIEHEKTAPDGEPWEPLAESTIAKKRAKGRAEPESILVDSHAMAESFQVTDRGDIVRLRNPARYGVYHQFGATTRDGGVLVARPFMGLSAGNVRDLRRMIVEYFRGLTR